MRFSLALAALAAPVFVSAAPFKRAAATDLLVLKFADVLEQLETAFYAEALTTFQEVDFISAGFSSAQIAIEQITVIGGDESTHSTILQSAIKANGGSPITDCKFDFSSVLTDVTTMASAARLVENVGVGAYLGAASLVSDPVLLTAAASILTIEARHQTILNIFAGGSAIPQAFDIALTPSQVLAIAGGFVSGCDVGVPANAALSITNSGSVGPGTSLSFKSSALNGSISTDKLSCQMLAGGLPFSISLPYNECVVPEGINGPVAIFITSDPQPLAASVVIQATNFVIAGPTMAFIDTVPQALSQMVRTSSGSGSGSSSGNGTSSAEVSVTTSTISPADASSILAGASSTATSSASSSTGSSSPSGSSAVGAINNAGSGSGGPNTTTGPSPDGKVVVNGWSNLPSSST